MINVMTHTKRMTFFVIFNSLFDIQKWNGVLAWLDKWTFTWIAIEIAVFGAGLWLSSARFIAVLSIAFCETKS